MLPDMACIGARFSMTEPVSGRINWPDIAAASGKPAAATSRPSRALTRTPPMYRSSERIGGSLCPYLWKIFACSI